MDKLRHPHETIIIIDFGGQYSQLIARRIRELNVYCEMLSYKTNLEELKAKNPKGLILSGGPSNVYGTGAPNIDRGIYDLGVPILGICYGMRLMASELGA